MPKAFRWGLATLLATLLLPLAIAPPDALAQQNRYFLQVTGDDGLAITAGRCRVLDAGTNTDSTIYSDSALATTTTNPITISSSGTALGQCGWYLSTSTTSVDVLIVVDSGAYKGARVRVDNLTRTGPRRIIVNRASGTKVLMVPMPASASLTATADSRTLPQGALIVDVIGEVTTGVANSHFMVGAGGSIQNLCGGSVALGSLPTSTVRFASCREGTTLLPVLNHVSSAIRLNNQNHATAGYLWIFYRETGNEP